MIQAAAISANVNAPITPCPGSERNCWYAAYTCPRHEKLVERHLSGRSIENYLPVYRARQQWKDRRKLVEFPLFPGYVFVRFDLRDRLRVLDVPGIVQIVSFNGLPAPLSDAEISRLRIGLGQCNEIRPYPYGTLTIGRHVRITNGPFSGLEGTLVRRKGNFHVILSVELIRRSLLVDVDITRVELVVPPKR
jgi:transcription antitermination factor NusG